MNEFELRILDFIRENIACPVLDSIVIVLTKLGNGGVLWIALAFVFLFFKKTRKMGITMGVALIAGVFFINLIVKNAVCRIRPYDLNPGIQLIVERLSDYSFPSGHALSCFEASVVMLKYDKRFGIPAIIVGSLIALSRMYLYVHYPSDVLAGAIFGIIIALISCWLSDKYYTPVYSFFEDKIKARFQKKN